MSSNVAQNYPYGSETDEARREAVEAAVDRVEGLRDKVAAETMPLGEDPRDDNVDEQRWWVWVCPADGGVGRLHVAGYARDLHAVYTVCDNCGKTFLR